MRTEHAKRSLFPGEPLRLLPIVFMSLFAVMVVVDVMIALQPSVLRPLRDSWQHWVGAGWIAPSWSSVFATGVAMAGVAIAASVLSVFIRGVQTAPYPWIAPIVVGSGTALMARVAVELPIPFSAAAFALISACALLGGGALIRRDAFAARFTAMLVMATPLLLLAIGYSQGASSHATQGTTEFVLVLTLTTLVTALLGYATREETLGDPDGAGEQLVELLGRARTAEARATFAEQQLASAGYGSYAIQSPRLASDDEELARMRGGSSGHGLLWAAVLFLIGSMATGYFAGYLPLQNRLDTQHRLAQTKDAQHIAAMTALRTRSDAERGALEAQLRAAQAPHVDPVSGTAPALRGGATFVAPAAPAEPEAPAAAPQPEPKAKPAKPTVAAPAVHARAAKPHAAKPARVKKTAARPAAKPAAAKPSATPAKGHYDDDTLDDDPIGGL